MNIEKQIPTKKYTQWNIDGVEKQIPTKTYAQ